MPQAKKCACTDGSCRASGCAGVPGALTDRRLRRSPARRGFLCAGYRKFKRNAMNLTAKPANLRMRQLYLACRKTVYRIHFTMRQKCVPARTCLRSRQSRSRTGSADTARSGGILPLREKLCAARLSVCVLSQAKMRACTGIFAPSIKEHMRLWRIGRDGGPGKDLRSKAFCVYYIIMQQIFQICFYAPLGSTAVHPRIAWI